MNSEKGSILENQTFSSRNIKTYLDDYVTNLQQTLAQVDSDQLNGTLESLRVATLNGKRIYVCGNGGSAAIADHLCCDWSKGTQLKGLPTLKTQSLSSNVALLTACANDFGFEKSFSQQLELFGEKGDVLLAISSSGNSENILQAVAKAKEKFMVTIGLSGFTGGQLKSVCDLSLHVNFQNYGLVEDAHQVLMHVLAQFFTLKRREHSA
jgi:D-sedoheptulose 7-phosphate isomerase